MSFKKISKLVLLFINIICFTTGFASTIPAREATSRGTNITDAETTVTSMMTSITDSKEATYYQDNSTMKSHNQDNTTFEGTNADDYEAEIEYTYKTVGSQVSWYEAKDICEWRGGRLAIHGMESYEKRQEILSNLGCSYGIMWIGLTDEDTEGQWTWINGKLVNPNSDIGWTPGEPNNAGGKEHCGELRAAEGTLNDDSCFSVHEAICEYQKDTAIPLAFTEDNVYYGTRLVVDWYYEDYDNDKEEGYLLILYGVCGSVAIIAIIATGWTIFCRNSRKGQLKDVTKTTRKCNGQMNPCLMKVKEILQTKFIDKKSEPYMIDVNKHNEHEYAGLVRQ